ncbi:MAG: hypothetical protein AAF593_05905 [Planctomycetota bacterium]
MRRIFARSWIWPSRTGYVVWKQGIEWYRDQVRSLGASFDLPNEDHHPGERNLHHGWSKQESNGKWAYGAYIECGRLTDGVYIDPAKTAAERGKEYKAADGVGASSEPAPRLREMVHAALQNFPGTEVMVTPNQDLLFTNIDEAAKEDFTAKLAEFGHGTRRGKTYSTLRVLSGACVGLPTCRLSYTDSEQFEPELLDELEDRGYGDLAESIGITGCERPCFRPATKTLGWIGSGGDNYALKLGGSEDGSTQGHWLTDGELQFLSAVPRERVADVCATLFDWYKSEKQGANGTSEKMGPFIHRMGYAAVLEKLKVDPRTCDILEKRNPPIVFDPYLEKTLVDPQP